MKSFNPAPPIISDSLGFTASQLPEMEAHRKIHCFSGIEFVRDKNFKRNHFYQVKCSSHSLWQKYLKSRGVMDKNSLNGSGKPNPEQLQTNANLYLRQLGLEPRDLFTNCQSPSDG